MAGLAPGTALLLFVSQVDVNATVIAETRGGTAPLQAGAESRAGVVGVVTPSADLELRASEWDLRLEYGPRIFWRQPNESGTCPPSTLTCPADMRSSRLDPLILHVANLSLRGRATPTVTLTGGASLSAGEADYLTLPLLVSSTNQQATLPTAPEILSASARAEVEMDASPNLRFGTRVEGTHLRQLGDIVMQQVPLPEQTSLTVVPSSFVRFSRRDELVLTTAFSDRWLANGDFAASVGPQVGWRRRLSPTDDLRFTAGISYAWWRTSLGQDSGAMSDDAFTPIGRIDLSGLLLRHRGVAIQGAVGGAADYFVDPILGPAGPRGSLSARCLLMFEPDWTAGLEASFATSLRSDRLAIDRTGSLDETVASVSLPVRHRVSDHFVIEMGGRWSDRAARIRAPDFSFRQHQLWVYFMVTATTRENGRWALPDVSESGLRGRPISPRQAAEVERIGEQPAQRQSAVVSGRAQPAPAD